MPTVRVIPQLPFITGPSPAVGIVQNTFTQLQQNLTGYQQEFQGAISGLLASASDRIELAPPVLDFSVPTPPQTLSVTPMMAPDLAAINLNPPAVPNLGVTLPAPPVYVQPQAPTLNNTVTTEPIITSNAVAQPAIDATAIPQPMLNNAEIPEPMIDGSAVALPDIDTSSLAPPVLLQNNFAPPTLEAVNIPAAPQFAVGQAPARPMVDYAVDLPDAPVLPQYTLEALTQIELPVFEAPILPTFDEDAPMFDAVAPNVALNFTEPVYESENFDDVLATIKRINTGGLGLPPGIEEQLFERARSREDRTAMQAIEAANDTFAGRGFVAPPGALHAELSNIRERNQLQANALQRDILIRVSDVQIENMRFAVTQGLASEEILTRIFLNAAQREFEAARFAVESLLSLYNTKVSVFNATVSAYQTRAQVYQTLLNGQLATLEVYRIQLEGERLKGELNQQKVQQYTALVQSSQTEVDVYRAQLQGAQTKVDVARAALEGYRTDVSAFAEVVGVERLKLDAYRAQVDAEASKSQVNNSRASVFQTLVQAQSQENTSRVGVFSALVQARTQENNSKADVYQAQVEAKTRENNSRAEVFQTRVQARTQENTSRVGLFSALTDAKNSTNNSVANVYQTLVNAENQNNSTRADVFSTLVQARNAENQGRASVFSTLVQANQAAVNVWSEQARVEIARVGANSQSYGATVEGYRAGVQAQLGRVQAQVDVQRAVLQGTSVQNEAIRASNEAAIRIGDQRVQTNIARGNASVRLYEVNLTRLQQQQDIRTRSLQAAGQYLATLTGGAMAAQNVSASLSASASDSNSLSRSEQTSNSLSESIKVA